MYKSRPAISAPSFIFLCLLLSLDLIHDPPQNILVVFDVVVKSIFTLAENRNTLLALLVLLGRHGLIVSFDPFAYSLFCLFCVSHSLRMCNYLLLPPSFNKYGELSKKFIPRPNKFRSTSTPINKSFIFNQLDPILFKVGGRVIS